MGGVVMLGECTRPDAKGDITTDVGLVDAWAAELTAIAYGTVPMAYGVAPDAMRAPYLTLISSTDEPVSISGPDEPIPGPVLVHEIVDSRIWREDAGTEAVIEQLARDIVAITQARDALMGAETVLAPSSSVSKVPRRAPTRSTRPTSRAQTDVALRAELPSVVMTLVPVGMGRTADSVPIILGSVLGFLMITIFSVAAVFIKFAR